MSSANRMRLAIGKQTGFGTGTAAAMKELRYAGESLHQESESIESDEIRADRNITDIVRTSVSALGDINYRLSFDEHEDLMIGAYGSAAPAGAADDSATLSANNVTYGSSLPGGTAVGDIIVVEGAADVLDRGARRITVLPGGDVMTVDGPAFVGASCTKLAFPDVIANGVVEDFFTVEKGMLDLSPIQYVVEHDCYINGMSLDMQVGAIMGGAFGIVGSKESSETSEVAVPSASNTGNVANTVDNIEVIREGGTGFSARQFSFTTIGNAEALQEMGSDQAIDIAPGSFGVTGTFRAYFKVANVPLADKFLNWTPSDIYADVRFSDGAHYVFDFPQIRWTAMQRVSGGLNQQVIMDMSFQCYLHPTLLAQARIHKVAA